MIVAENEPQETKLRRGRRSRAATAWMPCGTTIFITAPWSALTGHNEAYYTDYRGTPQEFISAAEVRLSVSGPVVQLAEEAARNARRSICRRSVRHVSRESRSGRQFRRAASASSN